MLTLTSLLRCTACQDDACPVICSITDKLLQEEVEKRRQRAQKFGTPLVEDGLQPALTSKQAKEAKQIAVRISEVDAPANTELTDAGVYTCMMFHHSQDILIQSSCVTCTVC